VQNRQFPLLAQYIFYVQDDACREVLGRTAIPQCENITKNNASLGTSLLNVSIF